MSELSLTTSLSNIQTLEAFNISNLKNLFWAILVEFCELLPTEMLEIMQMYKLSEPRAHWVSKTCNKVHTAQKTMFIYLNRSLKFDNCAKLYCDFHFIFIV